MRFTFNLSDFNKRSIAAISLRMAISQSNVIHIQVIEINRIRGVMETNLDALSVAIWKYVNLGSQRLKPVGSFNSQASAFKCI
ncbi:MAG: hypothetical protein IBX50_17230 [Marinospirillum sp.]|nr:hypothetical protein [Marinospirillum sp.]